MSALEVSQFHEIALNKLTFTYLLIYLLENA